MEVSFIIVVPGILLGGILGLLSRNWGTLGMLVVLFFLLLFLGPHSFTGESLAFWILMGCVLVHLTPIPSLNELLLSLGRLSIPRYSKRIAPNDSIQEELQTADEFWDSIDSEDSSNLAASKENPDVSDAYWQETFEKTSNPN